MLISVIRTLILYFFLLFMMRIMGKRELGQLEPFDLVTALMISELGVLPMENNGIPLTNSIVPIITIVMLQVLTSFIQLKSEKFRTLFNGEPSILIKDGRVDMDELRNQRFNLDDLMEELRLNGYFNLAEIHYAILETNGNISVMPKETVSPLTAKQLNITLADNPLPLVVISDGIVNKCNLKELKKDENWLKSQLNKRNIINFSDVVVAIVYDKNEMFIQLKNEEDNTFNSINANSTNELKDSLINFVKNSSSNKNNNNKNK